MLENIGKLKVERFVDNDPHGTRFAMLADISHRLLKKDDSIAGVAMRKWPLKLSVVRCTFMALVALDNVFMAWSI